MFGFACCYVERGLLRESGEVDFPPRFSLRLVAGLWFLWMGRRGLGCEVMRGFGKEGLVRRECEGRLKSRKREGDFLVLRSERGRLRARAEDWEEG